METKIFDNEHYYNEYPDVRDAVKKGNPIFVDGEDHYNKHGKAEGRVCRYMTKTEIAIETKNPGWTNHLTLNGYVEPDRNSFVNMVEVPAKFQQIQKLRYPAGNELPFEQYFFRKFKELKPDTFRVYLPIFWTSYYVNNGYWSTKELKNYISGLDRSLKYFTIIQYDDGILDNIEGLDILVYSMGCKKPGYYPLPLVSQPLNCKPTFVCSKDIFLSFYGADTHVIRKQLVNEIKSEHVKLVSIETAKYYDILKRTVFALCPRGYGITSFRMFEAMAFGCIPVYISDDFWEPFNLPFTEYGIKIRPDQIKAIPEILSKVNIDEMQDKVKEVYERYFVYSQCANAIIKTLTV